MRYHSLILKNIDGIDLTSIAETDEGENMAVCYPEHMIYGFQFHPESILSPDGKHMLLNWLKLNSFRLKE